MKGTSCFTPPKFSLPAGLRLSNGWAHFEADHREWKEDGETVTAQPISQLSEKSGPLEGHLTNV